MASSMTKKSKEAPKTLPKGSKILSKSTRITVEEIENGFLMTKNFEIKYEYPRGDGTMSTDWTYYDKKWYTKDDPLEITDKSLADAFDEEG